MGIELEEHFDAGGVAPGVDGWTGEVMVKRSADGAVYFEPRVPRSVDRLSRDGQEALSMLQRSVDEVQKAQAGLEERIRDARDCGVSWALIGWSLGVGGEAARKRWGGDSDE